MAKSIVVIRPFVLDGDTKLADAVLSVDDALADELVARGDASYQTPPTATVEVRSDIKINVANVADSGAMGRSLVQAANLTAALAALGVTLGANDSGGTGKRALVVNNA